MKSLKSKKHNREYMREYIKRPEVIKRRKGYMIEWRLKNKDKKKECDKKWLLANRTEDRICVICGIKFMVIKGKSKYPNSKFLRKVCSKTCRKIHYYNQQKKWRAKHPERVKEKTKEMRDNRKFEVFAIYSDGQPKCACCGENHIEFLTIDHINNDGAKHRREIFGKHNRLGGYAFYAWIKKNNLPEDLQVLCMNCQTGRKLNNGICPHKTQNSKKEG